MARTSARSSATRDQASSPLKRQSQSPVGRRTRSTRSQSTDLGESEIPTSTKRTGKRGARQVSVESIDSNTSAASSRGGRTRKATRATAGARDLSMVVEDRETEENEDDEDDQDEDGEANQATTRVQRSRSPGAMSQMSGTTAISSFSARTTHSQGEIGALDPIVAELLPDLWNDSYRILNLLAPANASDEQVESIVRELKVSGSRLAKLLMQQEKRFGVTREHYGNEPYIKTALIFQRLLGSPEPAETSSRPDAIIHVANLATLVKDFLVMEKESQSSQSILGGLDSYFPQVFVAKFDDNIQYGNSTLLEESFELALAIRTQLTIVALGFQKEQESWDPDQILLATFYDPPQHRSPPLSDFEDTIRNGRPKDLMGAGLELTNDQTTEVVERVKNIRSAFRQSNDAIEIGDLVDFEELEELFPWVKFLSDLVRWSRTRLDEISESIKQQGGLTSITQSFIEAVITNDSQIDINFDPPPPPSVIAPRRLQPAAEIMPGGSGQSLYNGDKSMVKLLEHLKRNSSSHEAPASTHQKASVASSSAPRPKSKQQGASRAKASKTARDESPQGFDDDMPDMGDGQDEQPRSAEEYAQVWTSHRNERNKENRPEPKRRLVDSQPGARQMQWDSEDDEAGSSTNKRKYQEPVEEEHEEDEEPEEERREEEEEPSEDEGFQEDHRVPDPTRRAAAPVAQRKSPVQDAPSPPKRREIERPGSNPEREGVRRQQQRAETVARARARREVIDEDENEDGEDYPPPTFPQASLVAKLKVAHSRSRMDRAPQRRVPWSEADTQRLIDGIEQFGCGWSLIAKNVDFDHPRDQVALKDKARNMKVTFLKAGIVLPLNLENVPLGKKEIASVRQTNPNYEP